MINSIDPHRNLKTEKVIMYSTLSIMMMILILSILFGLVQAKATVSESSDPIYQVNPTTTTVSPASFLEDPDNSATSESSEEDTLCLSCYEQVNTAQSFIADQVALMKKQQKIVHQKQMATISTKTTSSPSRRSIKFAQTTSRSNSSDGNKPMVVSRLRVARSSIDTIGPIKKIPKGSKSHQDPILKQMRHKQEQQLNDTCKSLYDVQQCLKKISQECHGDLQFHSHEVFSKQWLSKLNCPPMNDPSFRLFSELTRSLPPMEREKEPIPRPVTSQEETQKRLNAVFGGRLFSPPGVMLRPTNTRPAIDQQKTREQQPSDDFAVPDNSNTRHLLGGNEITMLRPYAGQLLLIPCLFVLMIVVIAISSRYNYDRTAKV